MNSSPFAYRSAIAGDAAEMVAAHHASVHAVGGEYYADVILRAWSPVPDMARRQWLADLIASKSTLCEVAVAAPGVVVGFCIAVPAQAQLKALYVRPEHGGLGIASCLLATIEAHCRAAGVDALELNASYNAVGFYQRNGYVVVRETRQSLADGTEMGAMRMVKALVPTA